MADEIKNVQKDSDNSRLFGAIAYILGIIALLFFLIEKENRFVKFHALQAALLNIVWLLVFIVWLMMSMAFAIITIPFGGVGIVTWICILPIGMVLICMILFCAWKAFNGEMYKIPVIGNIAEKYSA